MSLGQKYGREADRLFDPVSRLEYRQLTSFASTSMTLYFHSPSFTPDSKTLLFLSQTRPGRDSVFDLYRVDLSGDNLMQLTEGVNAHGAAMAPDGKSVFMFHDRKLFRIDLETAETDEVSVMGDEAAMGQPGTGSVQPDGSFYVNTIAMTAGGHCLFRCPTSGGESEIIYRSEKPMSHAQVNLGGTGEILLCIYRAKGDTAHLVVDADGSNPRELNIVKGTGHFAWRGTSDETFTTYCHPRGEIGVVAPGWENARTVAVGPYFWHTAASIDGEWYVSDTNWPDLGLFVVNHRTGRSSHLIHSQSSNSSAAWTHPHPMFSPDGRWVVFNSDRTGIGQVYTVEPPSEFLEPLTLAIDR